MSDGATIRTAFVFAGGGSLGAIDVGMLKALVAHGWTADFVVGFSVGAINAAQFACDPTVAGSVAVALGATRLVVLPTGYSCALAEPPRAVIGIDMHGLNLLIARHLVAAIRHYRSSVEVIVVPPLCPLGVAPYDFASASRLIDRAYASTEDWLANGVEMIDGAPHQLPPHSHRGEADAARSS